MSDIFQPVAQEGILHHYLPKLCAFEHKSAASSKAKPHSLLFISGLSDGLATVPYVHDIVKALEPEGWSVFSVLLSSSYSGWGIGSLDQDVEEIAKCVEYVKKYKADHGSPGMTVLMGHSTGSQDVLHYLHSVNPLSSTPGFKRPVIDGAILQAPVSDREGLLEIIKTGTENDSPETLKNTYDELVELAKDNSNNEEAVLLPLSMTGKIGLSEDVPVSARRFLSLLSPSSPDSPLEDDLFSSDLHDERLQQTFGMIGSRGLLRKSLLALPGGADEFVPGWVDKAQLLKRWETATRQGANDGADVWDANSGIVTGAKHSPSGESQAEPRRELASRVVGFLKSLESTAAGEKY